MKLFYWHSNAMRNYGRGHLITFANNIEKAKENIRAQFLREFQYSNPHLDFNDNEDHDIIQSKFQELENDLLENPMEICNQTILISGSE
jgi:hypothetical protein